MRKWFFLIANFCFLGILSSCPAQEKQKSQLLTTPNPSQVKLSSYGTMVSFPTSWSPLFPQKGSSTAPLRIVEFWNPLEPTSDALRNWAFEQFGESLQWVIVLNPSLRKDHGYFLSRLLLAGHLSKVFWSLQKHISFWKSKAPTLQELLLFFEQQQLPTQQLDLHLQMATLKNPLDKGMQLAYSLGISGQNALYIHGLNLQKAEKTHFPQMLPEEAQKQFILKVWQTLRAYQKSFPKEKLYTQLAKEAKTIPIPKTFPDEIQSRNYKNLPMYFYEKNLFKGNELSPILLYEFSDMTCRPCKKLYFTLKPLLKKYKKHIKFSFQALPLLGSSQSYQTTELLTFAREKGLYWKAIDTLFAHQKLLFQGGLMEIVKKIGLDPSQVAGELDHGSYRVHSIQSRYMSQLLRISAVPLLFLDGLFLKGAVPAPILEKKIQIELWKAGILLP